MRRILLASITAALIAVAILAASLRPSAAATPDVITEWSVAASKAATASEMAPLRTPITFALLHLAMYDAVTAIVGDRAPYAVNPPVTRPASAQAAAIEAATACWSQSSPRSGGLHTVYQNLLAVELDSPSKSNGVAVGTAVVQQFLASRANDGRNAVIAYTPDARTGESVPTPSAFLPATTAFLAQVTPFTMQSTSQFRPAGTFPRSIRSAG